jgi:glycosidase
MDFPLQAALVKALTEKDQPYTSKGLTGLYEALANDIVYANPNNLLLLGDNHDMDRLLMQLNQNIDLTKMALTYLLTIRGIPQFYYGTELLMDNTGHHKNDGLIRSDFPGGWPSDSIDGFSGKGLSADQKTMQLFVKKLLNWRKTNPVIAKGKTLHFAPFDGIYVYFRFTEKATTMVVLNSNEKEILFNTKRFAEILKGKPIAINVISGQRQSIANECRVDAKSATVFEIQ